MNPLKAFLKKYDLWIIFAACAVIFWVGRAYEDAHKPPCRTVPPPAAYLYNLDLYRAHSLQDELDEVEKNDGDQFEEEAAHKRVAAIPDAELDKERRSDLEVAIQSTGYGRPCPQ
jgi:hypothetical protein